jgi:DNA polymerase-3 subunit delta'
MILAEPVPLTPLPWLDAPWRSLQAAIRADRLGHALLITGPAGIGKRRFADLLAAALLCAQPKPDGLPCGGCEDCGLLAAGNHPDLCRLVPDEDSKTREIKAEQVRAICSSQSMTSSRGRRAIYRIAPAEAMNTVAANSLLKTLEEPSGATLWLLVSEAPGGLPATIRSRCHRLPLAVPATDIALPWLRGQLDGKIDAERLLGVTHGAPLRALAMVDAEQLDARERCLDGLKAVGAGRMDPLAVAEAWQALEPELVLDWLAGWVSDRLRLAVDPVAVHLTNPDQRRLLTSIAPDLEPKQGHRYLQRVYAARAEARSTVNKQLLFEALLLGWAQLCRNGRIEGARLDPPSKPG